MQISDYDILVPLKHYYIYQHIYTISNAVSLGGVIKYTDPVLYLEFCQSVIALLAAKDCSTVYRHVSPILYRIHARVSRLLSFSSNLFRPN